MKLAESKGGIWLLSSGLQSHFRDKETCCRCGCGEDEIAEELIDGLERLRKELRTQINISSGTRCVLNNKKVGGAAGSNHLPVTSAADIYVSPDFPFEMLYMGAVKVFNGVGLYKGENVNYIHIDIRPKKLYWYRKIEGGYDYDTDPTVNYNEFEKNVLDV